MHGDPRPANQPSAATDILDSSGRPATQQIRVSGGFRRRLLATVGLIVVTVLLLLAAWQSIDALLLLFAAVLLAVFLRSCAEALAAIIPLGRSWSLAAVSAALIGTTVGVSWLVGPDVVDQFKQVLHKVPEVREKIGQNSWAQRMIQNLPALDELLSGRSPIWGRIFRGFSSTLGAVLNACLVFLVGLFIAAEPQLYREGIVRLFPIAQRARAREVIEAVLNALRWWLVGKAIGMIFVALVIFFGLTLLGIPLALTLALAAGLLDFIPNIGPILALVPAALIALIQDPIKAVYVIVLYTLTQFAENYVLTPVIQRRTVLLPPALTIIGQILMGVLLGGLGVALATPMLAVLLVLVKMLYLEDVLGDRSESQG